MNAARSQNLSRSLYEGYWGGMYLWVYDVAGEEKSQMIEANVDASFFKGREPTKKNAALRQIRVAIQVFVEDEYEAAITLAGAAEGMIAGGERVNIFEKLKERRPEDFEGDTKAWIAFLNTTRDWLKHPSGGETNLIRQFDAWLMLLRALTKYQAVYGEDTAEMEAFIVWGKNRNMKVPAEVARKVFEALDKQKAPT
jgi:hypothetical protein